MNPRGKLRPEGRALPAAFWAPRPTDRAKRIQLRDSFFALQPKHQRVLLELALCLAGERVTKALTVFVEAIQDDAG